MSIYIYIYIHFLEALWKRIITLTNKYYPICIIWAFFVPIVSIRHPDDIKVMKYEQNIIFFLLFLLYILANKIIFFSFILLKYIYS